MITQNSRALDLPATLNHQQSSLPTPVTSIFGCEVRHSGNHSYPDAESSYASLEQILKRVGTSVRGCNDVCEWVSNIEREKSPSEDPDSGNPSDWTHLSAGRTRSLTESHMQNYETYSSGVLKFEPAHNFAGVVDELTSTAVETFHLTHTKPSRKRSMETTSEKGHKRPRLGSCQDPASAASVSETTENDTFPVEHPIESMPRVWPCPFFVRDRVSHLSCLTRHCLLSMNDVREHLCSEHLEPIHCSVCYETFSTARIRDDHMRSRKCSHRLPVIFDGIGDCQVRELQRQGSAADKIPDLQASQWIKIWSVVFSCTRPPPSLFSFSQEELRVYQFRRFWEKYGEKMIADVLEKHRLQHYNIEDEERNLDALHLLVADRAVDCLLLT